MWFRGQIRVWPEPGGLAGGHLYDAAIGCGQRVQWRAQSAGTMGSVLESDFSSTFQYGKEYFNILY